MNLLVTKLGKAANGGIKFYSLDNEPALWPSTHPRVHRERTTYAEIVQRTEATAAEIAKIDPTAQSLGAVMFGWSEFMSLSTPRTPRSWAPNTPRTWTSSSPR